MLNIHDFKEACSEFTAQADKGNINNCIDSISLRINTINHVVFERLTVKKTKMSQLRIIVSP